MADDKSKATKSEGEARPTTPFPAQPTRNYKELVARWFQDHFPNSPASRAGSDTWNLLLKAQEDLVRRLEKE